LSALKILGISARGSYGSYLLLSFSSDLEAQKIVQYLKSKKIYVKGPWSQPWDNCITITLGKKDLMEKFISVISEYLKEKKCVS
jgi:histidinol-phosphate/aromatic aminotransferase/cobyric acid decarboxylase-like protein